VQLQATEDFQWKKLPTEFVLQTEEQVIDIPVLGPAKSILFVTESRVLPLDPEAQIPIPELTSFFPREVAELFYKMVLAMKVSWDDCGVMSFADSSAVPYGRASLLELLKKRRPAVIVTLGAQAFQGLTLSEERLANAHGKMHALPECPEIPLYPLFHPTILIKNPSMKKTAWADMQKIMKHLKKLP
jgi:DNA polymerase